MPMADNQNDGTAASDNMRPRDGVFISNTDLSRLHERLAAVENFQPRLSAGVTSELHQRLAVVESSQTDLHGKVDDAVKSGHLDPGLIEKVKHVMDKYFPHDEPAPVIAAPVPRFDTFTGERLN